jgi:hypothetical protein
MGICTNASFPASKRCSQRRNCKLLFHPFSHDPGKAASQALKNSFPVKHNDPPICIADIMTLPQLIQVLPFLEPPIVPWFPQ